MSSWQKALSKNQRESRQSQGGSRRFMSAWQKTLSTKQRESRQFQGGSSRRTSTFRVLTRDSYDRQSSSKIKGNRLNVDKGLTDWKSWNYTMLEMKTWKLLAVCSLIYVFFWVVFTPFYWAASDRCALEINSWLDAMYLSLETMVTIGYGVSDQFFNECPEGIFIIGVQSLIGRFVDAAVMGFTLIRISRGTSRAHSIIFSDKAFLRVKRGSLFFSIQICDLRKHQLLEAHVRMYAIRHVFPEDVLQKNLRRTPSGERARAQVAAHRVATAQSIVSTQSSRKLKRVNSSMRHRKSVMLDQNPQPIWFQHAAMRVLRPDDELGGMLFLHMPTLIVHQVDAWSPLMPPPAFVRNYYKAAAADPVQLPETNAGHWEHTRHGRRSTLNSYAFPEVQLRQGDQWNGNTPMAMCRACGETYSSLTALHSHILNAISDDTASGHDCSTTCNVCGECYPTSKNLRIHRLATGHMPDGRRMPPPFSCVVCGETYESAENLRLHLEDSGHGSDEDTDDSDRSVQTAKLHTPIVRTTTDSGTCSKRLANVTWQPANSPKVKVLNTDSPKVKDLKRPPKTKSTQQILKECKTRTEKIEAVLDKHEVIEREHPELKQKRQYMHSPHSHVSVYGDVYAKWRADKAAAEHCTPTVKCSATGGEQTHKGNSAAAAKDPIPIGSLDGQLDTDECIISGVQPPQCDTTASHSSIPPPPELLADSIGPSQAPDEEVVKAYFKKCRMEVVVVLEGIDGITSSTVRSRHSYTVSDMVWEKLPVQCVFRNQFSGECEIDFGLFHKYAPPLDLPADEEWWPLQSHA